MATLIETHPTPTLCIDLPPGCVEDHDDLVSSYWMQGDELLLQLSSRVRFEGAQVSAAARMHARLQKEGWREAHAVLVRIDACPQVAAFAARDKEGEYWLFIYAVWPRVAVLITLAHPFSDVTRESWALAAVRSLRLR